MSTQRPSNVVELPPPSASSVSAVQRHGMGYRGIWTADHVVLSLTQCRYERGDLSGLLMVFQNAEFLVAARFNVAAQETRRRLAADLEERTEFRGWRSLLEDFCRQVIRLDSAGSPPVWLAEWKGSHAEEYLLEPLLPLGKPTILYGQGGSMKSTLATAAAVAVTTGAALLDAPPRVGRVMVLDWESDSDDWAERATALARGMGVAYPEAMIAHRQCDRPLRHFVESIAGFVQDHDVALLIVDSVGLAAGVGQEGGDPAETTLKLFQAVAPIQCTKLFIDHVSGDGVDNEHGSKRPYGSVYKMNLARSVWEMRSAHVDGAVEAVLRHRKVNKGRERPNVEFKVRHGEDRIELALSPVTSPKLRAGVSLEQRLAELMADEGAMSVGEAWKKLGDGISYDAVRVCLQRHHDLFFKIARGRYGLKQR